MGSSVALYFQIFQIYLIPFRYIVVYVVKWADKDNKHPLLVSQPMSKPIQISSKLWKNVMHPHDIFDRNYMQAPSIKHMFNASLSGVDIC